MSYPQPTPPTFPTEPPPYRQTNSPATRATQFAFWSFGLAIGAIVFAIVPFVGLITIPLAFAAAIIGHLAFKAYKNEPAPHAGRWAAWTGTITGWIVAGLSLIVHIFILVIGLLIAGALAGAHG